MAQVAVAAHPYLVDEYSTKGGTSPDAHSGQSLITKNVRRYIEINEDYEEEEVSKIPSSERFVLLGIIFYRLVFLHIKARNHYEFEHVIEASLSKLEFMNEKYKETSFR